MAYAESTVFVVALTMMAGVSALLGEWSITMGLKNTIPGIQADCTISTSMDHLGGALTATFGIALIAATVPITEALIVEKDTGFSWGRAARMMIGGMCSVGMFWVAMSPMKSQNLVGEISQEMRDKWNSDHMYFALFAFLALFSYTVLMTADSCNKSEKRSCGAGSYIGVIVGIIAVAILIATQVKSSWEYSREVFALGEYLLALSFPMTTLSRFTMGDMKQISASVVAAYRVKLNKEKARLAEKEKEIDILRP
jgi:magnesium-transporting ATPase (P-type)